MKNFVYGEVAPAVRRSANFVAATDGDSIRPVVAVGTTSCTPAMSGTLTALLDGTAKASRQVAPADGRSQTPMRWLPEATNRIGYPPYSGAPTDPRR
ncbi:hypothetical protein OHA18_36210 [Kribbella sp. NBC_00709]|uniref:hypothetical protein n=1 Tax=Kribbella sp. NBC_00709 TaxID=2975972 RepID=UPI002E2CAB19|nr:hypothetical protein [Kribbella sp. NBC_00709]